MDDFCEPTLLLLPGKGCLLFTAELAAAATNPGIAND